MSRIKEIDKGSEGATGSVSEDIIRGAKKISEKTICLCGSIKFAPEMKAWAKALAEKGKVGILPIGARRLEEETAVSEDYDKAKLKREFDAVKAHYDEISRAEAILVCNYDKNGVKNYIGANTFLEMGFAHCLGKKIYLVNPLPDMPYINDELYAFDVEVVGETES